VTEESWCHRWYLNQSLPEYMSTALALHWPAW
jgi:hypothetical protein